VSPRQADLLTAIGLLGLVATVGLTAPRWSAWLHTKAGPLEVEEYASAEGAAAESRAEPAAAEDPARRISVRLYFESLERDGLMPEERDIAFSPDLSRQVRTVVEELARGPGADASQALGATLPEGTRVLEVFVQANGVARVSLSSELASGLPGGSRAELLTVYSIVNTIVANFPGVSRVQLLLDDQLTRSLAGHVDLTRALPPDMTLVALEPLLPTPLPTP